MVEDAKFLKRKIRGGSIDVHPTEKALVVHYETEATILGELGNPMVGDRKQCQKIIRVKNLNNNTDIPDLAKKIVENCKLISEAKIPQIEHLLHYLLKRKENVLTKANPSTISEKLADPGAFDSTEIDEVAHLTDVDEYLELLYEDIGDKLRASALVLQLARNPDNLDELFQNETLVGALARVLREDWRKSTDLATNIAYIFFCFSSFSNFHGVILHFKIGALTMTIIEHELQKHRLWVEELEQKKRSASQSNCTDETKKAYETSLRKYESLVHKQEQLFRVSLYLLLNISEDLNVEMKMHNKRIVPMLCECLDRTSFELLILVVSFLKKLSIFAENKDEMLKCKIIERLARLLTRGEEELVHITLRLFFNLSFDTHARLEMVSHGLVGKLCDLLEIEVHQSIVLYLLYHLSIEDKSKKAFAKTRCLSILIKICLDNPNQMTELVPMSLAINLACDADCAAMFAEGKGIRLLMKRALKMRDPLLMKLLRNISMHGEKLKLKFVDYLPDLTQILTESETRINDKRINPGHELRPTQSAGAQNGSSGGRLVKEPTEHGRPETCHSAKTRCLYDPNNLELSEKLRLFNQDSESVNGIDGEDVEQNRIQAKDEDFILESLGCLANLSLKDLDFSRVLTELKLLSWIKDKLSKVSLSGRQSSSTNYKSHVPLPSSLITSAPVIPCFPMHSDDDMILEAVRLVGTMCQDPGAAKLLAEADIVTNMIELLNAKQEDDEIVCQIVHVFYQLTFHEETRSTLVNTTQAPAYLIDLMHDKNSEIRRLCDITLDIISDFDANWGTRIQADRFRWHNSQWLEMIDSATNPTVIGTDPTTEAVIAAALAATGQSRGQCGRRVRRGCGGDENDDDNASELRETDSLEQEDDDGPFGMGLGIDDAAAFLMSLGPHTTRKGSAETDERMEYLNQLDFLYPEMFGDTNFLGNEVLTPAASDYDSDSEFTPNKRRSQFLDDNETAWKFDGIRSTLNTNLE